MRPLTRSLLLLSLLLLVPLVACGGGGEGASPGATAETPEPTTGEAPASLPGPPPLGPGGQPAPQAASAGITYELPAGWEAQPPTSGMRLAQAIIPGPGGPGELTIFFFGVGGGGGVQANIDRWVGQMQPTAEPKQAQFESNGLKITWVEVEGTLLPSGMGTGPVEPQANSRLYGAVIEGPGGPWFFKATGPAATLGSERDAYLGLLESVRVP